MAGARAWLIKKRTLSSSLRMSNLGVAAQAGPLGPLGFVMAPWPPGDWIERTEMKAANQVHQ